MRLREVFLYYQKWSTDYYKPWTMDVPFVYSHKTNRKIEKLQNIISRCIRYYASNYKEYEHIVSINDKVRRILDAVSETDYNIGSYRADCVFENGVSPKIIEFTCRFPFNGFFLSGFLSLYGQSLGWVNKHNESYCFNNFLDYIEKKLRGHKIVIVSHDGEKKEESRFYAKLLRQANLEVEIVYFNEIHKIIDLADDTIILTEFNQEQYFDLSEDIIRAMSKMNMINDFRTIFLVHDKAFLALLNDKKFLEQVIEEDEIAMLKSYLVPTYTWFSHRHVFEEAIYQKDKYVLKHRSMGKSAEVYVGQVTSQEIWSEIIEKCKTDNYILQEFIPQKRHKNTINTKEFHDYYVGTFLFFDDRYFGPGLTRSSSHIVTNVIDDRKVITINEDAWNMKAPR